MSLIISIKIYYPPPPVVFISEYEYRLFIKQVFNTNDNSIILRCIKSSHYVKTKNFVIYDTQKLFKKSLIFEIFKKLFHD